MRRGDKSWRQPGRKLTVSASGIEWPAGGKLRGAAPNPVEIELCKTFLAKCDRTKQARVGSYGLKHLIEECVGTYISNGALIRAARDLGVDLVVCEGNPNAILALNRKSIREVAA